MHFFSAVSILDYQRFHLGQFFSHQEGSEVKENRFLRSTENAIGIQL